MTEIPVQRSCAELNMKLSYSVFRAFRDEWILLRGLRTREATDAVHLLEVLDVAWKDGRGQCSAVQGHKLRLAMRLADAGFLQKAYQYVVNTQAEVRQETAISFPFPECWKPVLLFVICHRRILLALFASRLKLQSQ